jgi:hypothetical protein
MKDNLLHPCFFRNFVPEIAEKSENESSRKKEPEDKKLSISLKY